MNKSDFEKLISKRAEKIYQDNKRKLLLMISEYFNDEHKEMNAHDCGNSLNIEIQDLINNKVEERKAAIIETITSTEISNILGNLESVRFLFDEQPTKGE
jgi:non-homologous end joining protein Ku